MKIDLHSHSKLSGKLPFSPQYTDWMLREAALSGLDAICLTEHCHSRELHLLYEYLQEKLPSRGDCYIVHAPDTARELKVFIGFEVSIKEKGDIVVIGNKADIWSMYHQAFVPYFLRKEQPAFLDVLNITGKYPVIMGLAHAFRDGFKIAELPLEQLRRLDFVELNGKDIAIDRAGIEAQTEALATRLGLPIAAGSDTHQGPQFGCIYNSFEEEHETVASLKDAICREAFTIGYAENPALQVRGAGLVRKALLKIHELGGEYTSVLPGVN